MIFRLLRTRSVPERVSMLTYFAVTQQREERDKEESERRKLEMIERYNREVSHFWSGLFYNKSMKKEHTFWTYRVLEGSF